jgi:hypothetical protein
MHQICIKNAFKTALNLQKFEKALGKLQNFGKT